MKFMRIFPDTCASTLCPFSSSTRNMAFGSGSSTVPRTSMASSFDIRLLWAAQDVRTVVGDRHRVLVMRREAAVLRHHCPPVVQDLHVRATDVDHRLDGEDH